MGILYTRITPPPHCFSRAGRVVGRVECGSRYLLMHLRCLNVEEGPCGGEWGGAKGKCRR
eukprot:2529667-Ditylum_brightwellii.AAC.1